VSGGPPSRTARLGSRGRLKARGRRGKRLLSADRRWAEEVKRRHNYTCVRCRRVFPPKSPELEAAHIFGKQSHPALRHDVENGVPLCHQCHGWAHRNPAAFLVEVVPE